ncbi:MAG TPA: response regulator [Usitatibacter sp.]|nr:response regulator [Usitatibacter sp.]
MTSAGATVPLKVIIADDSEPVAEMLRELVSAPGRVEVIGTADSETSTIEAIRALAPDVVILDLQLRTGSGTDVIRSVRGDPGLARTRLVVTSNHTSPQLRAGCLALGADAFLDKVKELAELSALLERFAREKAGA